MKNVFTRGQPGPPGPLAASVADPTAASALSAKRFPPGAIIYVQSLDAYHRYKPLSVATPNAGTIITAKGGGNFVMILPTWISG